MTLQPRIGLALSGGGVRGLAHVGVLKVLQKEQIPIHLLAGTSMGGFVAAAYAAGRTPSQIESEIQHLSNLRQLLPLLDRSQTRRGLIRAEKIMEHLAAWMGNPDFSDLHLPLSLVAVDLICGQRIALSNGSVLKALRATIALPGLFSPVEQNGRLLVDGGLLDNLPADVAREMGAEVVIAVDVSTDLGALESISENLHSYRLMPTGLANLLDILYRSLVVLMRHVNQYSLEAGKPDHIIRPCIPAGVTVLTGVNRAEEIIAAGEQAAIQALPTINKLLGMQPQ